MPEKTLTPKRKVGRTSGFNEALAAKICDLIREGYSERAIAKMKGMPTARTMQLWKDENPEFLRQSARARKESAGLFRERALRIVEDMDAYVFEVQQSVRAACKKDAEAPDLDENGKVRRAARLEIPPGWVEAKRVILQELNREAGLRDDANYGDRKTVKVDATDTAAGMADVYAKMLAAVKDDKDA